MYLRTESIKSKENLFFHQSQKEEEYDSNIGFVNRKINKLLGEKSDNLFGEFEWVIFENKLFNVKE